MVKAILSRKDRLYQHGFIVHDDGWNVNFSRLKMRNAAEKTAAKREYGSERRFARRSGFRRGHFRRNDCRFRGRRFGRRGRRFRGRGFGRRDCRFRGRGFRRFNCRRFGGKIDNDGRRPHIAKRCKQGDFVGRRVVQVNPAGVERQAFMLHSVWHGNGARRILIPADEAIAFACAGIGARNRQRRRNRARRDGERALRIIGDGVGFPFRLFQGQAREPA